MLDSSSGSELDATRAAELEVLYPQPGAAVVVLHDEDDLATKDQLRQTLTEALGAHRLVVVDVSLIAGRQSTRLVAATRPPI